MAEAMRVAVVTGGSRGIGRGICLELGALGCGVIVNYRSDAGAAETTCREAIDRGAAFAHPLRADIADAEEALRLVDGAEAIAGRIDLWVNNAGVAPERRLDLLETTPESWDRVLRTDLTGPFFLTQRAAASMVRMREAGTVVNPQIVFITSISARFASINRGEYCVAKAGLSMVAQLFAARLAGEGVRVYEIRPGIIATDMTLPVRDAYDRRIADGLVPMGRWGTPDDIGRAVAMIARGDLGYATGAVIEIDGGLGLSVL